MNRSHPLKKAVFVLVPTVVLVLTIAVSGVQEGISSDLFEPVYRIYQYVRTYYYQPDQLDDQQALYGAMKGIVRELGDPYSEFLDPDEKKAFDQSLAGEFSGVGIEITLENGILTVITPLVGSPAESAGMRTGDRILFINGESTEGKTLTDSALKIRGEIGTPVTLTVLREDGTIDDVVIVRDLIVIEPIQAEEKLDGAIAYIRILRFEPDTTAALDRALATFSLDTIDGIILDLRNNAGGLMSEAIAVANRFVDRDDIVLITHDRLSGRRQYYSRGNLIRNVPIAILINRGTASAAEILAGALRDNNMGILIGETSYGKGVFQQLIDFSDGSALKITTGEYFTPRGAVVHGAGITPDLLPEEGEDPVELAMAWIVSMTGTLMPIDITSSLSP